MNTELLLELYRLNTTVETILWVMYVILGVSVVQTAFRIYNAWSVHSNAKFRNAIENFYNRGEFSVVTNGCELRLGRHPNDSWSYWWKAKGHFQLGEFEEAEKAFNKVLALEPGWHKSVTPWLDDIKHQPESPADTTDKIQPDDQPNESTRFG
jgi:tetratricopeptide (TPR) repeat protein